MNAMLNVLAKSGDITSMSRVGVNETRKVQNVGQLFH